MFKFFSDGFNNFKKAVSNTASALVGNITASIEHEEEFSEFVLEDMEDLLISADLGVAYSPNSLINSVTSQKLNPQRLKNI